MANTEVAPACGGLQRHGMVLHMVPRFLRPWLWGAWGCFARSAWETPHKTSLRNPVSSVSQTSPFRRVLKAPISTLSSVITAGFGTYIILDASLVIASDQESFSLLSLRAEILHFLLRIGQHPPPPTQQHGAGGHSSTGTLHMV